MRNRYSRLILIFAVVTLAVVTTAISTDARASEPVRQCRDVFRKRDPFFAALHRIQAQPGQLLIGGFGSVPNRNPGRPSYRYTIGWDAPWGLHERRPQNGAEAKMTSVNVQTFYHLVYGQYLARYGKKLIKLALDIDKSLEIDRLIFFQIFSWTRIEGTFRMFVAHANELDYPDDQFLSLPFERLNDARKVERRPISDQLRAHAEKGYGIYEIGKFWVRHESDSKVRDRAVKLIELYWAATAKDNDIYVAHVMDKAYIRLYSKYGFTVSDQYEVSNSDGVGKQVEYVLTVKGRDFRDRLEELLDVDLAELF